MRCWPNIEELPTDRFTATLYWHRKTSIGRFTAPWCRREEPLEDSFAAPRYWNSIAQSKDYWLDLLRSCSGSEIQAPQLINLSHYRCWGDIIRRIGSGETSQLSPRSRSYSPNSRSLDTSESEYRRRADQKRVTQDMISTEMQPMKNALEQITGKQSQMQLQAIGIMQELRGVMDQLHHQQQQDVRQLHLQQPQDVRQVSPTLEEHGQQQQHQLDQAAAAGQHLEQVGTSNTAALNAQQQESARQYQNVATQQRILYLQQQLRTPVAASGIDSSTPTQNGYSLGGDRSRQNRNGRPRRASCSEAITAIQAAARSHPLSSMWILTIDGRKN